MRQRMGLTALGAGSTNPAHSMLGAPPVHGARNLVSSEAMKQSDPEMNEANENNPSSSLFERVGKRRSN
jgi:hypothetical protein